MFDSFQPRSSVYGILQARILQWVAIPFSRGSSQPRDQTQVSRTAGRLSTIWANKNSPCNYIPIVIPQEGKCMHYLMHA